MNFSIRFGLMWTIFTTLFLAITIAANKDTPVTLIFPSLFLFAFEAIGIYILAKGIKQYLTDKKTEEYGSFVYGRILDICATGSYENGRAEMQADILAYIPSESTTKIFNEVIGFNEKNYMPGMYVVLKHYENDVNINLVVDRAKIPVNVLDYIEANGNNYNYNSGDYEASSSIGNDGIKENLQNSRRNIDENNPNNNWTYSEGVSQQPFLNYDSYGRRYGNRARYSDNLILSEDEAEKYNAYKNISTKVSAIASIIGGVICLGALFGAFLPAMNWGSGSYYVNGVSVSKDEFFSTTKLFFVLFGGFGFIILISGIVRLFKKPKK